MSLLCEFIYLFITLSIGYFLFGDIQMSISQFFMSILDTILIIITYCSIFNFISMVLSEITISTTINIITFIIIFIMESSLGLIANSSKYITNSYFEDGIEHIISQEPNPNYIGDSKVKLAKTIYNFIPQGQANKVAFCDIEYLYIIPAYSIISIIVINILGIYLFSKKELK